MIEADTVIDVKGLTKIYGDKKVVDDFDLKVPRGAVYGFLGPNGSGKTTTIRMVCGLLTPNAGEGTCLGWDVISQSEEIKKKVGYMTQKFSLWEDLTIRENLEFVARMYEMDNRNKRVDDALDELGLRGREKQPAGSLSGGWKQRLALAACMMHEPELLLLDEPTAGVDPKARREFWDTIHEVADKGVTVLVSTHYMDEAVQCDYIAYIAYGKKLIDAPSGELVDQVGLHTWRVEGSGLAALTKNLEGVSGIEHIARFGTALHISGIDKDGLKAALEPYFSEPKLSWQEKKPGLEEVFIHLMSGSEDNFQ
jgi:ABC-2 type transport system ATP-binding protein